MRYALNQAADAQRCDRVAILFIGSRAYLDFFPRYYRSLKTFFLRQTDKTFFVFTDRTRDRFLQGNSDIHVVGIEHLPFPLINMLKFQIVNKAQETLMGFSHVVFIDADTYAISEVSEEEFFAHPQPLFALEHYKSSSSKPADLFETNRASLAAVEHGDDVSIYWQSCFWGGTAASFLEATRVLEGRTQVDIDNGVIARWWDESFLNKYLVENKHLVHTFPPYYCWPGALPVAPPVGVKLVHTDKNPDGSPHIGSIKKEVRANPIVDLPRDIAVIDP